VQREGIMTPTCLFIAWAELLYSNDGPKLFDSWHGLHLYSRDGFAGIQIVMGMVVVTVMATSEVAPALPLVVQVPLQPAALPTSMHAS